MNEWKPVILPMHGLHPELDCNAEYEWKRDEDVYPNTFAFAKQGPYFNVAGLWFREPVQ